MGNVHMEATQINYREGDKKMSVAQAIKNAGNTGLVHTADIAPEFSTESAYSAGDFVYHNGSLYEFTANHAAGAWSTDDTRAATVGGKIASLEGDVSNLNDIKANQITIAPAFSAEASYDPGDLVYYNGLSYRCVNAHEGEWDADDFAATTISNELASLMSGLTVQTASVSDLALIKCNGIAYVNGTATLPCTLPEGYRPQYLTKVPCVVAGVGEDAVSILPTGVLEYGAGGAQTGTVILQAVYITN